MSDTNKKSLAAVTEETTELCQQLMRRPSVTPDDQGCQTLIAKKLADAGFEIENMRFGDVDNLWARRGKNEPLLVLAGHTDVVPTGDVSLWSHPPFDAVIDGDHLYGRGAADMKGGLAALITAATRFCHNHPNHRGSIAFLITSDEEGPAINGTAKVVETLQQRDERIDYCLLAEPSSTDRCGDIIRNGRRGSMGATLTVKGVQGHVAYPHLADNPVHKGLAALSALTNHSWDNGNEFFPATTFQISNVTAGTGATNVIPATMEVSFNLRFSTELTPQAIRTRTKKLLHEQGLNEDSDYSIVWNQSGQPFVTEPGELTTAAIAAVKEICGIEPQMNTAGGTSDGRFIAPAGAQLVELGPCNASIHQIDENVSIEELGLMSATYENILERLLLPQA